MFDKYSYIGETFDRLKIIKETEPVYIQEASRIRKHRKVLCVCTCGSKGIYDLRLITSGRTKSCGCLKKECVRKGDFRHGLYNTNLYTAYRNMINRCYNEKNDTITITEPVV